MSTRAALETVHFDTAPGIRLHAKVGGPVGAPTLLFVHGFPEFWYTWHLQLAEFCRDYRCVAIDMRGFVGTLTEEDQAYYRACWRQGLTGGCNYYRASPLHPDTAETPGKIATLAAALKPEHFRVEVPTQVIWGTGDVALRPALLAGLEQHVADLRIHRIEGAGHWLTRNNAEEVNRITRDFLQA
jgi:pimeloyl-ACP methyl ester carboxylesterase